MIRMTIEHNWETSPLDKRKLTKVMMEIPGWRLTIDEMCENILKPFLLALGFHHETVSSMFQRNCQNGEVKDGG